MSYVYLLVVLLMSDIMSYYLTNVIHIGLYVRLEGKTSPDATHYTERAKN